MLLLGDHMVGIRLPFVRALEGEGIRVTVAAPPDLDIDAAAESIRLVTYPLDHRHPIKAAKTVRDLRDSTKSEIVHAFSTLPATVSSIASWLDRDGCYVRTVNGLGRSFSTTGLRGLAMRTAYTASMVIVDRNLRCSVFQNRDDNAWFGDVPLLARRRHQVILGSGVDLNQFDPSRVASERVDAARTFLGTEGRVTAILIGRHLRSKGVDDLAAAAEIASTLTSEPILLAVVGPPETGSNAATSTDSTHGSVAFKRLGSWSDMPALYLAADIVVLPTRYREGIPRVLLEGAAMRRPLLAYDVPGCREIVEQGGNGYLLKPGDVDALARHVVRIAEDAAERRELGERSRQLVAETFAVEAIAGQYAALYRDLIG
jgi:glycosyltransferase involved in cell wall biosynthesis